MEDELRFPEVGPKFEVWNHLESGLDLARLEIDAPVRQLLGDPPKFGAAERDLLPRWADIAFSGLTQLVLNPDAKALEFQEIRRVYGAPGAEPWLDFAVDLRFAEEGVSRARTALARYRELRRARLPPRLSARARHYVTEAVHTYLFGFDIACVVFCGAALEQQVKDACVRGGLYTEPAMRRAEKDGRGGMKFLEEANRGGLITTTYEVARGILRRRNAVLHRGVDSPNGLGEEAARTLLEMSTVFHELDTTLEK